MPGAPRTGGGECSRGVRANVDTTRPCGVADGDRPQWRRRAATSTPRAVVPPYRRFERLEASMGRDRRLFVVVVVWRRFRTSVAALAWRSAPEAPTHSARRVGGVLSTGAAESACSGGLKMSFLTLAIVCAIVGLVMLVVRILEDDAAIPNGKEASNEAREIGRTLGEKLEKTERSLWIYGGILACAALCYLANWIWLLILFVAGGCCWVLASQWRSEGKASMVRRVFYKWLMNRGNLTRAIDDVTREEVSKEVEDRAACVLWKSNSKITCELMAESENMRHATIRKFRNSLVSMVLLLPSWIVIAKYLLGA